MRLLIDTQLVVKLLGQTLPKENREIARYLADPSATAFVSVASLWEIAIKSRLGKLSLAIPLDDVAAFLKAIGLSLLSIEASHAIAAVAPEPQTRDPFDRLLLAQCSVENLKLVTVDRALISHPLALNW